MSEETDLAKYVIAVSAFAENLVWHFCLHWVTVSVAATPERTG